MSATGNLAVPKQLAALLKRGESSTLEFKRSTAELQGAMPALCAFLNASGGKVIIGIGTDGRIIGQEVFETAETISGVPVTAPEPTQSPTQFIVFWQFSRRVNCLPVNCVRL